MAWLAYCVLLIGWSVLEVMQDFHLVSTKRFTYFLIAACGGVVWQLITDPVRRLAGLIWLLLLLYFASCYLTFDLAGLTPHPYISAVFIESDTLDAMRAYALSLLVFFPLLRTRWCLAYLNALEVALARIAALPRWRIHLCCAVLFVFAVIDWANLGRVGLGAALEAERRTYAKEFLLSANHNAQLIAIAFTILVAVNAVVTPSWRVRMLAIAAACLTWAPSFMIGARKEVFIISVAVLTVWLARRNGGRALLILFLLMGGLGLIPLIFGAELEHTLHEFALPFYNVLTVEQYGDYVRPSTSFIELAQFLLPSEMRFSTVRDFGTEIETLMKQFGQNVGYGGHPYAESLAYSTQSPALMLLLLNGSLIAVCAVLIRINPTYTLIAVPFLALWGRSLFWISLFFIIYGGLIMAILTSGLNRRGNSKSSQAPSQADGVTLRRTDPRPRITQ